MIAVRSMLEHLRRLHTHRTLLVVLVQRELKARYRGSALGFLWSFVNPLLLLAVYTIVFQLVLSRGTAGGTTDPYALFLFTGLLPWTWFSASLLDAATSLTGNDNLLRKVLFPAEILPLTYVGSQTVHFLLALPILAGGLILGAVFLDHPVSWTVLLLPLPMALLLIFTAGLALVLAPLAVHFRDVRDLTQNALNLAFFLTPILYSLDQIPLEWLRRVLLWNPFAHFILAFQDLAFHGRIPTPATWALMLGLALASWIAGTTLFERLRDGLVEAL